MTRDRLEDPDGWIWWRVYEKGSSSIVFYALASLTEIATYLNNNLHLRAEPAQDDDDITGSRHVAIGLRGTITCDIPARQRR